MKNYSEVIQQLIDVNDKLIDGKISVEAAKQICTNTQTLINAAKLHLEVLKYKKQVYSDFFNDPIEPIDKTLKEIEEKQKLPYKI